MITSETMKADYFYSAVTGTKSSPTNSVESVWEPNRAFVNLSLDEWRREQCSAISFGGCSAAASAAQFDAPARFHFCYWASIIGWTSLLWTVSICYCCFGTKTC